MTGLLLSIELAGCARQHVEAPGHAPAAVAVKDSPPSDLLVCPEAPAGFPEDQAATIPPAVRDAAVRVLSAYRSVSAQLARLIEWNSPGACSVTAARPH